MHLNTQAIVCAVLGHGEHGAIARLMTHEAGLLPGYVRGGRSRRLRPVLLPGNMVQAEYRARVPEQLAQLSVELVHSRAPLLAERLPSTAIDWLTTLTAATLPEGQPYPALFNTLEAVLSAVESANSARGWAPSVIRYELLLLAQLGFALDLSHCAGGGDAGDLAYVSPKSSIAVSRAMGAPYAERLLPLPGFLTGGDAAPGWEQIAEGFRLTGYFLARDILTGKLADICETRERLIERLARAG
ncbi:DNA repair protein RecO [Tardibacter chloracetimidivorans]|uniref:DNA repair protein RecO n=1 Tax=Tardibacter chloracetimidivorans TaxID=1921510 RepID=A0A1L3ZRU2_9SPHN|nr:DNA repair protein RecO [Tardibacter chloracetimidivorans]API58347.1 DNA repair protein RecO [Tardibacter chloracetimidivorans]